MAVDRNELILEFKFSADNARRNVKKTNSLLGRFRQSTSGIRREIGGLRNDLLLASFAFAGVTAAIGKVVGISARFEAVKTRLVGLTGSVENAEQAFDNFNKVAATTPFTLDDVVDAGAQLQAFGADANDLIIPITDLAAFMGTTAVEAANAFGRAFAGGAGAADILRERGILNIIKSSQGIEDLSKTTLPEFRKALITSMQDPVVGIVGSSERLSRTFSGLMSNMMDSMTRLGDAIGDGLMPIVTPMIASLKSGAEFAERFIRGLTETSLETTIRELKEFEGNVETLTRLKELELNQELLELEKTAEELNIEFRTSEQIQKAINEEQKKREKIILNRVDLLEEEDLLSEELLFSQRQISALEKKRLDNNIFKNKELFRFQADALQNQTSELVLTKQKIDEIAKVLDLSEKETEESRKTESSLKKQLAVLLNIERIRNVLGTKLEAEPVEVKVEPKLEKPIRPDDIFVPSETGAMTRDLLGNMAERFNEIKELTDEGFFPEEQNELDFMKEMNDLFVEQVQKGEEANRAIQVLGAQIKSGDIARADETIKKAAEGFKQFGDNIAFALLNGQNLGDAVVNSIKAIAAELIAQQAALSLMQLFFPGATAAKAGFDLLGSVGKFFKFHDGGFIGGNANNVPIVAQSGEFVMQRSAVQSIGLDSLSMMNETGQAGNVTINIHGGIVQEDYVRNELIPAINRSGARVA